MIYRVYAMRDSKVGSFTQPMFFVSDGACIRAVADVVKGGDKSHGTLVSHPGDFELFRVAEFNDQDGTFSASNASLGPCDSLG